jgi:hydrogenase maturation protease
VTDVPAAPVTVAGSGNWLLAQDRVGPQVLARLADRLPEEVELAELGSSSLALLDWLRGQELLVVVDACVGRGAPGEVSVSDTDGGELPRGWPSLHQIGPLETLAVARALQPELLPRRVVLVQVETGGLPPEDEEHACAAAVTAVERELESWRHSRVCRTGGGDGDEH